MQGVDQPLREPRRDVRESTVRLKVRSGLGAGPERELIQGALASGLVTAFGTSAVVFQEPELDTGYPDIVAVFSRNGFKVSIDRSLLTQGDLQLLHHLWTERGASVRDVTRKLSVSERTVWQRVERLVGAALLRVRSTFLSPRAIEHIFAATRIIAYEAKVDDWRGAVAQASANRWFASHSYLLFPARRFVSCAVQAARELGVGVIVFDGERTRVELRAVRQRIPASVGSWLVNEWAVGRRSGDA